MQKKLNMPELKLKIECATRWNSTYYMMERLVSQKVPLNAVLATNTCVTNLTPHEWQVAEEYVSALRPLEQATKIISATKYATISMIIPMLNSIIEQMKQITVNDFGKSIIRNVNARWPNYEMDPVYGLCTLVDPRFKLYGFSTDLTGISNLLCTLNINIPTIYLLLQSALPLELYY